MSKSTGTANTTALQGARHVLQRSGFGESVSSTLAAVDAGADKVLSERLAGKAPIAPLPPPAWTRQPLTLFESFRDLPKREAISARKALRKAQRQQILELRGWWLSNLLVTDNPLGARLTLFWQNHFTSSHRKVNYAELMYRQHVSLMRHASGSFRDLLSAMLRDPAMLIYLDAPRNRRDKPNENLGRELLELFTLGEGGGYDQRDVREVARALSGIQLDETKAYRFNPKRHDAGDKLILGERGAFAVDEVVEVLLAHPGTAEWIVHKLWQAFVLPEPPERSVRAELGALYRASDYDTRTLMRALFEQPAFRATRSHGQLVKSPVEFVIGTCRALGLSQAEPLVLVRATQAMGMDLYAPPTVQGWPTGERWINAQSLLARDRFVANLLRDDAVDLERAGAGRARETILGATLASGLHDSVPAGGNPLERALRSAAWNLN